MSEETRSRSSLDQVEELWKQWYETSSKVWTEILEGAKESYVDPYGLYRSWLKTVEGVQGTETVEAASALDPREAWRKWFEATGEIWHKSQEIGTDPLGMTTKWFEIMEEARQKLLNGATPPADSLNFLKQWYESSNEVWSKAIGELVGTEKFVEATGRYIESYTSFYKTFRRLNEDYFSKLQLTTRADLARVAEIIIALESKVDWIQDAFEDFQGQFPQFATLESTRLLATHLENLENKLQRLPEAFQKIDVLDDLSQRLMGIEGKLNEIPPALQKLDAIEGLGQRLDGVEGKLNEIPPALQKFDALQGLEQRFGGVEWKLGEIQPKIDALQGLDQRIGGIEWKLGEISPALQKIDAIQGLDQRLGSVEGKLNEIPPALQKLDALQELDQRLSGVEGKLGELPGSIEKIDATGSLEKRLDGVENKLDRLLTLLEQIGSQQPTTIASTRTSPRRTSKAKTAPHQETPETESEDTAS